MLKQVQHDSNKGFPYIYNDMKVTLLGTGASLGVPVLGCRCGTCTSANPKNKRLRASCYVEIGDKRVLIDASPDLREQTIRHNITTVDAVIITHAHADHCHGIDDLRALNYHKDGPIDLYTDAGTMAELQQRFAYIFTPHKPEYGWYKPWVIPHIIDTTSYTAIQLGGGVEIKPFPQVHGKMHTLGLRAEHFAYSTDVNNLVEESFQALENIDVWVVDCLQEAPAPSHAHLDLTLKWIERVNPKQAILTHMSHSLEHEELSRRLPPHIVIGYDGMEIRCDY